MSFVLSKLAWLLFNPANLLILVLAVGVLMLWLGAVEWGRRLVTITTVAILLLMVFPVGTWLTAALENRFPRPKLPDQVAGIIVLGGSSQPGISASRKVNAVNGNIERLIAFADLAQRFPAAKLVFTGGRGRLIDDGLREADAAAPLLVRLGVAKERLILERESRNTAENARLSRKRLGKDAAGLWILVTSARHMPRAAGAFREAGWRILPYPVDYTTPDRTGWIDVRNAAAGMTSLNRGLREWIGLVWYRLRGWSGSLFPGPDDR